MKYTTDIEIPRLIISVDFEADSWSDATMKAAAINPLKFVKTAPKATIMDSEGSRVVALILQD